MIKQPKHYSNYSLLFKLALPYYILERVWDILYDCSTFYQVLKGQTNIQFFVTIKSPLPPLFVLFLY